MPNPPRVVVCVPWRGGSPSREKVWEQVRANLETWGLPIYLGDGDPDLPFNRAAARNAAAYAAGDWDVAIFIDADTYVPINQIAESLDVVMQTRGVCLPFERMFSMHPVTGDVRKRTMVDDQTWTCSGNIVVHRDIWDEGLRWDERLNEWGWEDGAFVRAAYVIGSVARVNGSLIAIEHARRDSEQAEVLEEKPPILEEYKVDTPEEMLAVMARATMVG